MASDSSGTLRYVLVLVLVALAAAGYYLFVRDREPSLRAPF